MPVLNVFAKDDHIVPPATTQALKLCVGSKDYQELPLPGGHVGVFVGGKSQGLLGPGIANWLAEHDNNATLERFQRTLNRLGDSQFRIGFPDDGRSGAARII